MIYYFIVPLLKSPKQIVIGDLVHKSLEKKQESKRLLEQAKTRVEQHTSRRRYGNEQGSENQCQRQFLVYKAEDGRIKIDVRLEGETVWLTQKLMADLFQTTEQNIGQHLKNVFFEHELLENSVVKKFFTTATDRKKYQTHFIYFDYKGDVVDNERFLEVAKVHSFRLLQGGTKSVHQQQAGGGTKRRVDRGH